MYLAFVGKMEKGKALAVKREGSRKRKANCRKDLLMTAYINKRHPLIYKEAEAYYNKLNELHPTKIDLRKTIEFRALPNAPMEAIKDNMCLDIPLIATQTVVEVPSVAAVEIVEECPLPADLETIEGILEDELPAGVMENIIKELKADPQLNKIMQEIEDLVYKESEEDEDIDIDFETDDRLENELRLW